MSNQLKVMDANEAVAHIAYKTNDICAIYPITPSSTMGEYCDEWTLKGKLNIWGDVPRIQEMQSEGGAAGALHGSLTGGALATSFTSSQGLLLMIPDMFKIAGELTPFVLHIAARTIATHALSIFGDHSDVMAVRGTGFGMLFASHVQEAMDFALISHASTLKSRVPFLNIFDGFRTSHELSKISVIPDSVIKEMIDENAVAAHRNRALTPVHPTLKGTAQNPDVFFQNREACNLFYQNTPEIVKAEMKKLSMLTGRFYDLFQYEGHPDADRVIILMGSGVGAVRETVRHLIKEGDKLGLITVHLFRPFSVKDFIRVLPGSVKYITVLDRTKEPGAIGEPLYQDIVTAISENMSSNNPLFKKMPKITGGRYGLSSKEFTPAMVKAVYEEMVKADPKNHFTVGINDDVTFNSLDYDPSYLPGKLHKFQGLFYGLGADGTVGANKNSIKIIGESTDNYVQGYFVYDSKKSGSTTISHLRFGDKPINSTYLIQQADFIACHQFNFVHKFDMLRDATLGSTFLLNAPFDENTIWEQLPAGMQKMIIDKKINFYVIDATRVAREAGLGSKINTILQTCFFAISDIIDKDDAISRIKEALAKTYASKGEVIINKNFAAVDKALENLKKVNYPDIVTAGKEQKVTVQSDASEFVRNVLQKIIAGEGDDLPVSAFPVDGTYPTSTTHFEKRNIASVVPVWDEELCTQCNKCIIICPHAAIRAKVYDKTFLDKSPEGFKHVAPIGKDFNKETEVYTLQVAVEDCTGCNLCIEVCPIENKEHAGVKAINMHDRLSLVEHEKKNWDFFFNLPEMNRERINMTSVKGTQFLQPLFEFSSACSGCGETPYLKVITQLFGNRMVVANATGCSSIYGANLPTTPWAKNKDGFGPAWANSLFEDNAEFGLGIKLAYDQRRNSAVTLLKKLSGQIGDALADQILENDESTEQGIRIQHELILELRNKLNIIDSEESRRMMILSEDLIKKSVWIIGGDGWAYDIGYGGLDHVLSTGENLNILVLDTEVYSNTGGQTSKSTPVAAVAKYSASGKKAMKKNLGQIAITNGNVFVAQIALGANDSQTLRAINEAEAFPGTSLIIAYSHCIAHGFDLGHGASQQSSAVKSGYWPLYRFNPLNPPGKRFSLDSKEPSIPLRDYMYKEGRYSVLQRQNPEMAEELLLRAEDYVKNKWDSIKLLSTI